MQKKDLGRGATDVLYWTIERRRKMSKTEEKSGVPVEVEIDVTVEAAPEADGYYGEDYGADGDLDLSFLDSDEEKDQVLQED